MSKLRLLKIQKLRKMSNSNGAKFGWTRKNENGTPKIHQGTDFEAKNNTEIIAPLDCKLVEVGNEVKGYGIYAKFECYNNLKEKTKMFYLFIAHLNKVHAKLNVINLKGSIIATTGITGNAKNLPISQEHLHVELHIARTVGRGLAGRVDPLTRFLLDE